MRRRVQGGAVAVPVRSVAATAVLVLGTALGIVLAAPARGDTLATLRDCARISGDAARLACYDRAVAGLAVPAAPPASTAAPAAPDGRFGAERLKQPEPDRPADAMDSLSAAVAEVQSLQPGRYAVTLDNGQIWVTVESTRLRLRPGDTIRIERGMLDSYNLSLEGRNGFVKVRRVR